MSEELRKIGERLIALSDPISEAMSDTGPRGQARTALVDGFVDSLIEVLRAEFPEAPLDEMSVRGLQNLFVLSRDTRMYRKSQIGGSVDSGGGTLSVEVDFKALSFARGVIAESVADLEGAAFDAEVIRRCLWRAAF